MRRSSLFLVLVTLAAHAKGPEALGPTGGEAKRSPAIDDELVAARRARGVLAQKLDDKESHLHARVRALYKLSAFGDLPLWVDEGERSAALARRGAARRVILRDLEERKILRAEVAAADADVARLERDAETARFLAAMPVPDGSLARPARGNVVASFGIYTDADTHVRLFRRGVELHAPTPEVVAAASGQVTFAGPLAGLGTVVLVDHGQGVVTVTAGLAEAAVARGDLVAAGDPVGRAASGRIYFEVRRGGRPVDPFPLLRAAR
jgi:septal ring factor EnvC (AmiA/AmiB activator)